MRFNLSGGNIRRSYGGRRGRRLIAVAAIAGALALVAACGSSASSTSASSTTASASSQSASPSTTAGPVQPNVRQTFPVDQALRALVPAAILARGYLNVGAGVSSGLPQSAEGSNGQWIGSDADLITAIASMLGLKVDPTYLQSEQQIVGLTSGRTDLAAGSFGEYQSREEQITYVTYFHNLVGLVTDDPSIKTLLDVCGKTVDDTSTSYPNYDAVVDAQCKAAGLPDVTSYAVPESSSDIVALESHRIDAYFYSLSGIEWKAAQPGAEFRAIDTPQMGWIPGGIGFKKTSTGLQQAFLQGMEKLVSSGYYQKVLKAWGISYTEIPKVGINLGGGIYWADNGAES